MCSRTGRSRGSRTSARARHPHRTRSSSVAPLPGHGVRRWRTPLQGPARHRSRPHRLAVRPDIRELEFHTDTRSAKWQELTQHPAATVIGYAPLERLQVRLEGPVSIHHPDSDRTIKIWTALSAWTRQTYCGGPPGDSLAFPPDAAPSAADAQAPTEESTEPGRGVFGVVSFRATSMDWFRLNRQSNRRAVFRYDSGTSGLTSSWVNP